jgi:tetratricopeptide (TPR) repeat protein
MIDVVMCRFGLKYWCAVLVAVSAIPKSIAAVDGIECGSLDNAYGPYDYRTATNDIKRLVERPHFDDQNAAVNRGQTRARENEVMNDLDYTLRALPNHPGALAAIDRLGKLMKTEKPSRRAYKLECYYIRGERMANDDPMVYYTYGMYLNVRGRKAEAREKIEKVVELYATKGFNMTPNMQYNIGLVFFDLGAYDESQRYAQQAYEQGYSLPGLKNKLKSVGRWKDSPHAQKPVEIENRLEE